MGVGIVEWRQGSNYFKDVPEKNPAAFVLFWKEDAEY